MAKPAMSIEFRFEWEDAGRVRAPELRATWARLEILVNNTAVTRVLDQSSRSERFGIYVSLFPLVEWLTQNWFFLFWEVGSRHSRNRGYLTRHCLRFAGEGFAFPHLQLLPSGEYMDLKWSRHKPTHQSLEFIEMGDARLHINEAKKSLSNFIQSVIDRLNAENVAVPTLTDEWQAIQSLQDEELEYARAAAAFGVDPFDATETQESEILMTAEQIPEEALFEFLTVSRNMNLLQQTIWLNDAISRLSNATPGLPDLVRLASDIQRAKLPSYDRPFDSGYDFARKLRDRLGIDGNAIPDLSELTRLFGSVDGVEASGIVLRSDKRQPIAAVAVAEDTAPRFLLTKDRDDSRRFALCRGIFDYLSGAFERVDIVADSYFDKDKASRAFAAEFLIPSEGLRSRIVTPQVTEDDIWELAEEYNVSTMVVENQIRNHGIAEIVAPVA